MSKIVKGGPFGLFKNPVCCKISKKLKGDPLETLKSSRKKKQKMTILDSLIVTKNRKRRGGFGLFQHPFSCEISKKIERGPFSLIRFCRLR